MWQQFLPRPREKGLGPLRTLVVGGGQAGRTLIRDLRSAREYGLLPVGVLDDRIHGRVGGVPVLGRLTDLSRVAQVQLIQVVVIAIPSLNPTRIRELSLEAAKAGASVRFLPSFLAALERDARLSDLRSLRLDQLLGREEVHVTQESVRAVLADKRVLVTGAGGSIGSELCRQVNGYGPSQLFLLDHDESNLHRLQLELGGEALLDADELIIADIRDRERLRQVFQETRPQVVFHAAAHKHLPLLERHPCEGVKSNVFGTGNVVDAAIDVGAERFILISTDKAADPTSVLGATKRLAEMVVQDRAQGGTRFASVRFGNVLGSRGSFLSVLAEQVSSGTPVTVTHPDVTRFFMTVEEAVGLVLEAGRMAEFGEVFVLDMGRPVRIVDLVHNYARQLHLPQVDIRFTGLRPGEKLNECLFSTSERRVPTAHPKINATLAAPAPSDFVERLALLARAAEANDRQAVMSLLADVMAPAEPVPDPAAQAALSVPYPDGF